MKWQPIETAPKETRKMFVAIAANVKIRKDYSYTSDPYCVWKNSDGTFSRWPHEFSPTHWMPIPKSPS
jgi:hypothetical protein